MSEVQREFLGWSEPALPLAADWLLQRYGSDLSAITVVLPGRRAGRRLMELLVQRAPNSWCPPKLATLAEVSDMLVTYSRPRAGHYQRILCWTLALQACPPADLEHILSTLPAKDDLPGWWKLADLLDRLHIELAAESLTFRNVLGNDQNGRPHLADAPPQEQERWRVLSQIQNAFEQVLEEAGLCDRHLERASALRDGHMVLPPTNLVLLGVASANRLQRHMLEYLAQQHIVISLILAPHRLAHFFDSSGFLQVEAWQDFDLGLEEYQWTLVDSPEQQAEEVVRALHAWSNEFAHDEITLGALDHEHLPFVERQLAERGVPLRSPEGTPLSQTPPLRLLLAVTAWLETRSFESFASLLRHSDVEDLCASHLSAYNLMEALDDYFSTHLPQNVSGQWLEKTPLALAHKLILEKCGELAANSSAPASSWSAHILRFLQSFYGHRELDRSRESDRKLAATLQQLASAAAELADLGDTAAGRMPLTAGQALRLFAAPLLRAQVAPGRTKAGSIETVGWLELPLDDAPNLIVTDFREGTVPAPLESAVFLPESLRTKLGMPSHEERLARDLYATAILLNTRLASHGHVLLLCCRHTNSGESLLPSRLLFHCSADQHAARALAAFGELPPAARFAADDTLHSYELPGPRSNLPEPPALFSASRINTYLHSPYEYYLKYVCKMQSSSDQARELDPLHFGNLIHKVLEQYGLCEEMLDVFGSREIANYLNDCLEQQALLLFGSRKRSTVQLQLLQMRHRLAHFAEHQADLMAQGWRIHAVEWQPPQESVKLNFFDTTFRLQGRIDRIDFHAESNCWRIYDYKSGDAAREMKSVFKPRSGKWTDVQLPLYHFLAQSLVGGRPDAGSDEMVQVGYFNLPKSNKGDAIQIAQWDATAMTSLQQQVAAAVQGIRAADFFAAEQPPPRDPRLAVLAGIGLLAPVGSEPEEDDGASES